VHDSLFERARVRVPLSLSTSTDLFFDDDSTFVTQTLFKNVRTITLFVETNQADASQTKIGKIQFFGTPVHTTDVACIKKC
jgi:hypothetical protein